MKIVHIAPNAPYNEYWGYQENLLPKYQKKLGHEVTLIVPNLTHRDGRVVSTEKADYVLSDGVRVIRLERKRYPHRVLTGLNARLEVLPLLRELKPDFIFYHGLVSSTIFEAIQYKKKSNPRCVIVQDNHLDYNIGFKCRTVRDKLIRGYHRWVNRRSIPFVERVYGVTPWRKTYAEDYFHIPQEKTDVLIMGADDEKIDFPRRDEIRQEIRGKYGISEGDFLVVTGGKIDEKKKIHLLMEACAGLESVKLLVFGNPEPDIRDCFQQVLAGNENVIHIGWIEADWVYDFFFAADLVMFPGQHSVLWEQACAAKVPCVFGRWDGMEYLDQGGNCEFINQPDTQNIRERLLQLFRTPRYEALLRGARSNATDAFLYGQIAAKSLEKARRAEE